MTDGVLQGPDGRLDPVALTQALVRCPSITPADAGALDLLQSVLEPAGFTCHRLPFQAPRTDRVDNLVALIGEGGRTFCFAGHTDVVPPGDLAAWSVDPFGGVVEGGRLIGRGAADMKGAVAAFAAAAVDWVRRQGGGPLPGRVALLITGDEEGPAVNGTKPVLEWMAARGLRLDACLVGEPTCRRVLGDTLKVGRRGSVNVTLTAHGVQGHAAYPHLADNPLPRLVSVLDRLAGTPLDGGTDRFGPSTLALTSVDVGNPATNVTPARATAKFNIRFNDRHTPATLEAHIMGVVEAVGGRWDLALQVTGDAFTTQSGALVDLVAAAVRAETGQTPTESTDGGTSDARFIKDYCPVLEFGLVGASMHKVDENVPTDDLTALARVYGSILDRFFAEDATP